jgi:hypothetical protein
VDGETLRLAFGPTAYSITFPPEGARADSARRRAWFREQLADMEWRVGALAVGFDYSGGFGRDMGRDLPLGGEAESLVIEVMLANAAPSVPEGTKPRDLAPPELLRWGAEKLLTQRARLRMKAAESR